MHSIPRRQVDCAYIYHHGACIDKWMSAESEAGDMARDKDTSIRVSGRLADELHSRKNRGDAYEDVIWRLIEKAEDAEE